MNDKTHVAHTRRNFIAFVGGLATLVATALLLGSIGTAKADDPKPMLMFVQLAQGVKIDPSTQTLRLIGVSPQTLYFADRPERIAGHIKMDAFMAEWTSKA
jgi:hypothetical protein